MKQSKQTTPHKDGKQKQRRTKTMKSHTKKKIEVKNTYFSKREREKNE